MMQMAGGHPGVVVVTGASSGLGQAVAVAVSKAGGTPVGLDIRPCDDLPHSLTVDVSDRDSVTAAVAEVAERHGGIDAVVTAAGVDACGALQSVPAQDWDRVISVNLMGTVNVVRSTLPFLHRRQGRVATVASTLGHRAAGDATAYCASKFGVVGFTRALQAELRESPVSVMLVTPGGMRTPFFDGRDEKYRPGPDSRLLEAEDVAGTLVDALCRPGAVVRELVIASPGESSWP